MCSLYLRLLSSCFLPFCIFNESLVDGKQLPPSSRGLLSVALLKMFKMPQRTYLKMHVLYLHF